MAKFYSASAHGFFDSTVDAAMPVDAVAISDEDYQALLARQADGHPIVAGKDGRPTNAPLPRHSLADRRTQMIARVKAQAHRRIVAAVPLWRQLNDLRDLSLATGDARAAIEARMATIDALRITCAAIETSVATMAAARLATFDPADDTLWDQEKQHAD